jgi:hypothetical protein
MVKRRKTHRKVKVYLATKKMLKKRYVPTKATRAKHHKQTGHTNRRHDMWYQAKKVGWRQAKSGRFYYEARANRSDRYKRL